MSYSSMMQRRAPRVKKLPWHKKSKDFTYPDYGSVFSRDLALQVLGCTSRPGQAPRQRSGRPLSKGV